MVGAFDFAPAIPLLPFASFLIALLVGYFAPRLLPKGGAIPGVVATAGSLLLSAWMFFTVSQGDYYTESLYTWVVGDGTFSLHFGLLVDPLSAMMLVVVSLVAFLVHVFSLGYMNDEDESGLPRYYAGLGLFTFSMLSFVVADNLLMAFMFFELVGLCSYLLIGFWFREQGPPSAAKKAFLVTRFGDYFFLIGVVGIFATFGTSRFVAGGGVESFPHMAEQALLAVSGEGTMPTEVASFLDVVGFDAQTWFAILGLLVLGGVIGKSAQFPLHTWLPDAMEGPTPVSALIHAATMVAAGVYLVARMYGFYSLLPTVLALIALVGGFTALFAASMGVVKDEIKQVLAYSTISQYGYIMLGLGAGGYIAASFHLLTHAIFKALLFLGAGSVIIAMHHNEDMWDMGGLKERMPVTYYTFLSGSLALAGIVPFAGFWSKDEILYETLIYGAGESPILLAAYAMGLLAVFFTGFYTFRMVFLTFHGEPRSDTAENPHGVRWNVKFPLVVLGVLAATVGLVNMTPVAKVTGAHIEFLKEWLTIGEMSEFSALGYDHYHHLLHDFSGYTAADIGPLVPAAVSLALALSGAGLAWMLYNKPAPEEHTEKLGSVKTVLYNNYYQDEYQVWLAEGLTLPVARAADTFDQGVIDGVVNGVSSVSLFSGSRLKRIQDGVVTHYAAMLTLGLIALLVAFGLLGGWF
ncbi:NADH-quinone oxidoreductase subunit L [Halobacterium litoreum]|uniref:NADH-quinone oxidoreductase subunit L n=1 Tax=Halobacterium litoreum TaxID=2039234 RepID=A0ABD5NIH6_9EURY|nr:NADH-quinone oxidoreductase subunit L [Halobacterium litoreum]UHH12372.1 NADH-quinone oxidoreductase subunit L [Halobacterium litoreum]